jgi:multiple sugar transport system substrate-binding protein
MLKAISNGTHIDIISLDEIWLGEFAEKGLLTDLTNYTEKWGRTSDWYQSNLAGGVYKGKMYGIWFETDVRGIWYWKDLLSRAKPLSQP